MGSVSDQLRQWERLQERLPGGPGCPEEEEEIDYEPDWDEQLKRKEVAL